MEQLVAKEGQDVDFLPINGTDYIEFYVSNCKQSAHYYQTAFGFQPLAYSGPETGVRDRVSYVLKQRNVTLILTSPLEADSPISEHIRLHGDSVKAYALSVDDAEYSFNETTKRGGEAYMEPKTIEDDNGKVKLSGIHTYGDVVHVFVERNDYDGVFMPGFQEWDTIYKPEDVGFKHVDHCVGNVPLGHMDKWVDFYADVMGFTNLLSFDDQDISTEYSALMSKVMTNGNGFVKFPINEPAEGKKKSQIDEYLEFNNGSGVQHIALATNDILSTVKEMKQRGVQFIRVPDTYYDDLLDRVGHIDERVKDLQEEGILVDRDDEGYMLQIFTLPVEPRPTLFFEVIQRKGAKSFGKGNFKALFEAIEREQKKRGNL